MRITSKGQVAIPKRLREKLGLQPHTEIEFVEDADGVRLVRKEGTPGRGAALIEHMREHCGTAGLTTDEIMELSRGEED